MLPHLEGRPLALKRFPEGITGHSFFQQNAPAHAPDVVRIAEVATEEEAAAPRIIGGDLPTLLYCVQLGAISLHAWMSRITRPTHPDFSLIDLDPGDDTPFTRVVQLANAIRDVLREMRLNAAVKTSGSSGLHIAIPLPRSVNFVTSAQLAERVAMRVLASHGDIATLERSIARRPAGTVYLDVQQNAMGKSVVAPYSVRSRTNASVSAPLRWREVGTTLDLQAHTVRTMPRRLGRTGDLWGEALEEGNGARTITAALKEAGLGPAQRERQSSARTTRSRNGAR